MANLNLAMYYDYILIALIATVFILFIINIILFSKVSKLNKRFDKFITNKNENFNLEDMLTDVMTNINTFRNELDSNVKICADANNITNEKFDKLINQINIDMNSESKIIREMIDVINNNLKICIQKTAVVRYNPFDNVGGELCFALAMLDKKNDGYILNTIFTDNGCYTYCKPVINAVSTIKLSKEEQDALDLAKNKVFM